MGGHFHDTAAGTATPRSYEFAWNDDVIAMNQFAGVLTSATEAVASALNTQTRGTAWWSTIRSTSRAKTWWKPPSRCPPAPGRCA